MDRPVQEVMAYRVMAHLVMALVLQEQPHPEFKRKGDDLFIERTIALSEALCGFSMDLDHLDGRTLHTVCSRPSCHAIP